MTGRSCCFEWWLQARGFKSSKVALVMVQVVPVVVVLEVVRKAALNLALKLVPNVVVKLKLVVIKWFISSSEHDHPCRFLVSKLFDVTENSQLTDMYEHKPIRIPYGKGIVGYVAESGETVNIPDAYQVCNVGGVTFTDGVFAFLSHRIFSLLLIGFYRFVFSRYYCNFASFPF